MNYKVRVLNIKTKEEGLAEFKKIGADTAGCNIMVNKIFNFALKIKDIDVRAANILKQEALSRGGDVVTPRRALYGTRGKTDVIILGTRKGIKSLIEKIKMQPFGLKELSDDLNCYINRLGEIKRGKILKIGNREFNLENEVLVIGVLNVTPDSFYDGGYYFERDRAYSRVDEIVRQGAQIIDVGGMSSRPGSLPVSLDEEINRTIPVIKYTAKNYDILISVDTYHSEVAEEAVGVGAHIINDISGLTLDKNMAKVVAESGSSVIIMHMKGTPENMQDNPEYKDVVDEIYNYLYDRTNKAVEAGIDENKIIVDPGIGFGKTLKHNLVILNKLSEFKSLGYPLLVGVSRKSFIGTILDLPVQERMEGSIAAAVCSIVNGANILRVHDVKETIRAVKVAKSIIGGNYC